MPVTIPVTLPDDLAEQARAKGLLSPTSLTAIISAAIKNGASHAPDDAPAYSPDLDPRLKGAVNPLAFKRGKIVGDVVGSLDVSWEAES